jgi:hypothetical protein
MFFNIEKGYFVAIKILSFVFTIFYFNLLFTNFLIAVSNQDLFLQNQYIAPRFETPSLYSTYTVSCGAYSPCSLANGYKLNDQNATFVSTSGSTFFGYTFLGTADVDINVVNTNTIRFQLYTSGGALHQNTNIKAIFQNTMAELSFPVTGKNFYIGNLTTNVYNVAISGETRTSGFLAAYFNNIVAENSKVSFTFADASGLSGNDIFSINGNTLNIKESTFSDLFANWDFNISVNNFLVQKISWKNSYRYTLLGNSNMIVGYNCDSSCNSDINKFSSITSITLKDSSKFSVENTTLNMEDVVTSKSPNTIVKIKQGKINSSVNGYVHIFHNLILDNGIFEYKNTVNILNSLDIAGKSTIKGGKFTVKNLKINNGSNFTLETQETTDFLQNTNFSIGTNAIFNLKTQSPVSFNNGITLNSSIINIDTTGLTKINGNMSLINSTFSTASNSTSSGNISLSNSSLTIASGNSTIDTLDLFEASKLIVNKISVKNLKINNGSNFTLETQETADFLQNTNFSIGTNATFNLKTQSPVSFNSGITLNSSIINIDTTGLTKINGNMSLINSTFSTASNSTSSGNISLNNSSLTTASGNSTIDTLDVFGTSNLIVNKISVKNLKINNGSNFTLETQETTDFLKNANFSIGENVNLSLKSKSEITLNNKIVLNNSKLNFEINGLNIIGDVDAKQTNIVINTTQNTIIQGSLNLNNVELNSTGNININQNLNVLGSNQGGSKIVAKDLNIEGSIVAELTKLNKTNPLFIVDKFSAKGPIKLNFDSSSLIKVGEFESYVLVQSQQKIDTVNISYDAPSDWIKIEPSYLSSGIGNILSLNAQRQYTYEDVLKNANLGSEFTRSIANAIDKEMSDGLVSNGLSAYINGLDATKNAQGLDKALSSSQAIDQEDFINYVSKYSSSILDNVVNYNYVFANNFWVNVDYNNGVQVSETIDNGMLLILGYGHTISKGFQWSIFGGASFGNLEALNYISDNVGIYFGSGLYYQNRYRNYFTINALIGNNTFNTTRSDGALLPYVAKNTYNNADINVEYGKKTGNYIIAGYANINAIQLQAYQEEGMGMSYVYDKNKLYNSGDGGLKIGFISQTKQLKLEALTKLGYKINSGGSNILDFKIENTTIEVLDNSVDSAGLYIKPRIGITYRINKKNMLSIDGEYEYMQNGYSNTSLGLAYKILLIK